MEKANDDVFLNEFVTPDDTKKVLICLPLIKQ